MSIANELGVDFDTVLYLKTPPDEATLRASSPNSRIRSLISFAATACGPTRSHRWRRANRGSGRRRAAQAQTAHAATGRGDQEEGDHRQTEGSGARPGPASGCPIPPARRRVPATPTAERSHRARRRPTTPMLNSSMPLCPSACIKAPPIKAPNTPTATVYMHPLRSSWRSTETGVRRRGRRRSTQRCSFGAHSRWEITPDRITRGWRTSMNSSLRCLRS